jgi:hypothetical protein
MENGNEYKGEWQMGEMHGMGKLIYKNGDVQEGEFRGNRFLESMEQKKARLGYEKIMEEVIWELCDETRSEVVVWERKETQRLQALAWEMEDPEYEAKIKIKEMREKQEELKRKRLEERRLKKLREETMKKAVQARLKRERKLKERRDNHEKRLHFKEMLELLGRG